jgi:hypothetical protein
MKNTTLCWWRMSIVVALVIVVIPVTYYVFGREHYAWEQDNNIMRMSATFKSIEPGSKDNQDSNFSRMFLGTGLFPIIKIGMSDSEVRALLGEPTFIDQKGNDNELWRYILWYSVEIRVEITKGKVVRKERVSEVMR